MLHTPFLKHKSPYRIMHNKLPNISTLKVFGSLCFASTLKSNRKKQDPRSTKCIHLSYKAGVNGHILFNLHFKELFISRDVMFLENYFLTYKIHPKSLTKILILMPTTPFA